MKSIMTRAWEIKHEDSRNLFSVCLQMAWEEAKQPKSIEEQLVELGGKRWTKGNFDRIYFNADFFGLECDYYKSGNICSATLKGEKISNSYAGKLMAAKSYYDVKTGIISSSREELQAELEERIHEIMAA